MSQGSSAACWWGQGWGVGEEQLRREGRQPAPTPGSSLSLLLLGHSKSIAFPGVESRDERESLRAPEFMPCSRIELHPGLQDSWASFPGQMGTRRHKDIDLSRGCWDAQNRYRD